MSLPRRFLRDQLQATSRRTEARRLYLTPLRLTNQIVDYLWILIASRYAGQIRTYGVFFLGNHYHALLRDLQGGKATRLSDYQRDLNSLLAKVMNAEFDRGGALWRQGSYSNVEVHGDESEIDQLLYLMAQPVAAGLTSTTEAWPGVKVLPEDVGMTRTARRPKCRYFGGRSRAPADPLPSSLWRAELQARERNTREAKRARKRPRRRSQKRKRVVERDRERRETKASASTSTLPEFVSYTIPVPRVLEPLLERRGLPAVQRALRALHDANVKRIVQERRAQGLGFLGRRRILQTDPFSSPGDDKPTWKRNPRIACKDLGERFALYTGLQEWRVSHAGGYETLCSKKPWRARFPTGAYLRARELTRLLLARGPPIAA